MRSGPNSPTATTRAFIRGITSTTWACGRTSCGNAISRGSRPPAPAATRPPETEAMSDGRTHFGFEEVSPGEKTRRVRGVFDSVANKYDVMNDVMSAGLHRLWKRFTVEGSGARAGKRVLDLRGGTGDHRKTLFCRLR